MLSLRNTRVLRKKRIINIVSYSIYQERQYSLMLGRSDTLHLGLQHLVSPFQKGRLPYRENDM